MSKASGGNAILPMDGGERGGEGDGSLYIVHRDGRQRTGARMEGTAASSIFMLRRSEEGQTRGGEGRGRSPNEKHGGRCGESTGC